MKYDPTKIEAKWIKKWEETNIYKTPEDVKPGEKYYVLPQTPYPSGYGLHVGHAEGYTASDIIGRYNRMKGKKVLEVMGWDSFGLPAENYAIKTNVHPKITTEEAIKNFIYQCKRMGLSVDWDREVGSHRPYYYKFTQWFFLLFYKMGLAYREMQQVNWCESCKTVLANDQVVDGKCERCDTIVTQIPKEVWFLRITKYAERLDRDLDLVDWPEDSKKRQRDWIGISEGARVKFMVGTGLKTCSTSIDVFTTRPDTLFGATFMTIAPEHKIISELKSNIKNWEEVSKYLESVKNKTELERKQDKEKTGVKLEGVVAVNPVNNAEVPIYVSDYVLVTYGTGAIMCVPAHDERDYAFAKKFGVDIIEVVREKGKKDSRDYEKEGVFTEAGTMVDSGEYDGMNSEDFKKKIVEKLSKEGIAKSEKMMKLRDWSVARQRFWGAPIPMILCEDCGYVPVPEKDLPVMLPDDVDFKPTGESPLRYSKTFHEGVTCPKCGKPARREVDTLDTFMCSSWYYYRYLDPHNTNEFASEKALKTWMPVDMYIGGREHVTGHLLYSRFFTKVLKDAGYIDFDEPFIFHRHQGMIHGEDGRKMSKRWGNIVNPTDVMDRHGGDTLRLYEMFMGPLEDPKAWSTKGERGVFKFVNRTYKTAAKVSSKIVSTDDKQKQEILVNKLIKYTGTAIETLHFNTNISQFMEFINAVSKFANIDKSVWERFLLTIAPYAPFLTEELWEKIGNKYSIHQQAWPRYDESLTVEDTVDLPVQINGKTRGNVMVSVEATEDIVVTAAKVDEKIGKYLTAKAIKKVIYLPGKIVNIVV
ncbi:leucine--tRNA ligase [Candidatus Dojkabacteria bacterium]|nr:leucine--tRNA ligase [Candidatus Dojkabacteria bacterium]